MSAGIGRAIAKRVDRSGMLALYDVLAVRGFGDQRRVFVRYAGHSGPGGQCLQDPDAVAHPEPTWCHADRFHVHMVAALAPDLADTLNRKTV